MVKYKLKTAAYVFTNTDTVIGQIYTLLYTILRCVVVCCNLYFCIYKWHCYILNLCITCM